MVRVRQSAATSARDRRERLMPYKAAGALPLLYANANHRGGCVKHNMG